jgi:type 1 glutamine amidotransferase
MGIMRYGEGLNVLVAVKGHPYQRDAFAAVFEDMVGVCATVVEQPAAACLMSLDGLAPYDALVLYDMPGIDFRAAEPPQFVPPQEGFREQFEAVLEAGKGVVALHHAIAGWPSEEWYAELLGGRFLYRAATLRGRYAIDSGYRHDVAYSVMVERDHPVTAGLPPIFPLTDELYLSEVFESSVVPLLRSSAEFIDKEFYSASLAVQGHMYSNTGWSHPPGSNLIGWVKRAVKSPLVYLQPGDGPATYADQNYRKLLRNAIHWAASAEALAWARGG